MTEKSYELKLVKLVGHPKESVVVNFTEWMKDIWKCDLPLMVNDDSDSLEKILKQFVKDTIPYQIVFGKLTAGQFAILKKISHKIFGYVLTDAGDGLIYLGVSSGQNYGAVI